MSAGPARFAGQVAVITGAAQGIGLACARRLGREGARVVIGDIAAGPAAEAVETLAAAGIEARAAVEDVSGLAGAERLMAAAVAAFGTIDVLVNNVGGTIWTKPFWHYTEDEMRQEVQRSLWPTLVCARAAIPVMQPRGGAIVNIGSNAVDGVYRVPYSACKGAVAALTTALAVELADFGIRVNCVAPGGTEAPPRKTARAPRPATAEEQEWERQFRAMIVGEDLLGRFATADEQAAVVAFLASADAGHITGEIVNTGRRGRSIGHQLGFVP